MNCTATIQDPPTPQPELFSLCEEEPGGSRPDRIPTLSGPQAQVLRHTVQQIVDPVPSLPALDDLVPQMVEQLPDILHFLRALSPDPEKRTANKIADIPVPSGGLRDFPQTLHRAGVSSDLPEGANQGFLALFPSLKSAKI